MEKPAVASTIAPQPDRPDPQDQRGKPAALLIARRIRGQPRWALLHHPEDLQGAFSAMVSGSASTAMSRRSGGTGVR